MSFKKGAKVWAWFGVTDRYTGDRRDEWRKAKVLFVGEREYLVKIRGVGVRVRGEDKLVAR
jgi:hypothetical protein